MCSLKESPPCGVLLVSTLVATLARPLNLSFGKFVTSDSSKESFSRHILHDPST
jgi:hypothetical protein